MQTKQKNMIWGVAFVALAAGLFFYLPQNKSYNGDLAGPTSSVSESLLPTPSPFLFGKVKTSSSPSPDIVPKGISKLVPECSLGGEIVFIQEKTATSKNALFSYDKAEDPHDYIEWSISPSGEEVSIGPNMFAGLTLPTGSETITISFNNSKPKYKQYTLTASVNYPAWVDGATKSRNTKCSGETRVTIDY